jgi:hypothetical protein
MSPVIEPLPIVQKQQEVLPARPATREPPPSQPKQEVVTAQGALVQPEPGPELSALMRMPGRELLAPSALDMRRLRRVVGREGPQVAVGAPPAERTPDGGSTIAVTPQEVRAGPVRLPPGVAPPAAAPPVRLPPAVAQPAAGPPVRLPPMAVDTPEPRPVRLPLVDHVAAVGPRVSPEPEPQPVEPAGEAVMVTDDVPPPRDSLSAVAAQWETVAAGPLRLTLKTPPPPKASSSPSPERPVAAAARLAPKAAEPKGDDKDPKGDAKDWTAGRDGDEGVAFASDGEETPQRPLQLSIRQPSRDATPRESTRQAPDARTNR